MKLLPTFGYWVKNLASYEQGSKIILNGPATVCLVTERKYQNKISSINVTTFEDIKPQDGTEKRLVPYIIRNKTLEFKTNKLNVCQRKICDHLVYLFQIIYIS